MKRISAALAALVLVCTALPAQSVDWQKKYERQVKAVGLSGVGVETILDSWGAADSSSVDYLAARYAFWFDKSHSMVVEAHDSPRYLGMEPMLELSDSSKSNTVWYYQVDSFDDELFGRALRYLDKAAAAMPAELEYRVWKVSALMLYEKESPDMTLGLILSLIDEDRSTGQKWLYQGEEQDRDFFDGLIQEFCWNLFNLGTPQAREAFLKVSEKMLSYDRKSPVFMANVGSYLMSVKEYKKALKQFDKVLKLDPDNDTAIRNCVTIARILRDDKLKSKYNPMLSRLSSGGTAASY
ncbi:MAG: tetratricopeptide repeat protein [Candidatus Cryptobacteroides sp.]|nr:tetratricopeptide repeat protein [Candidatus Cryptobacteroides sp.]MDY4631265.1 tetratricopeptide repeat protein [Candidatus Cryptobacteroides sp.]